MYKDKELESKGYIKEIHLLTKEEAEKTSNSILDTGSIYWLGSEDIGMYLWQGHGPWMMNNFIYPTGITSNLFGPSKCYGIRPVIEMNEGVYIASGSGTETDPYVLGKD